MNATPQAAHGSAPEAAAGTAVAEPLLGPALALLRAAAAETDAWYEAYVRDLAPEQLAQTVAFTFTDGDHGAMTREEILLHVITHGGYHRGNVGQLLKAIGMAPPRELYTRFLHLREPQRRG